MSMHTELIARARKSYRSLNGVIVVSPTLVADLADALEAAETTVAEDMIYMLRIEAERDAALAKLKVAEADRDEAYVTIRAMVTATPPAYPRNEDPFIVLGPEIFTDQSEDVLCWKGVNHVRQAADSPTTVEWGIEWTTKIPGFWDVRAGYETQEQAEEGLVRSTFPGTVVSRKVSTGPWIAVQS